ncbi:MAG TPA: hypothetical protein VL523_19405, partial [Terriglobia bacterium]|nr:hypothetical protein [Terriglobia bacterium]
GPPVQFVMPVAATLDRTRVEAQLKACGVTPGLIHTVTGATHDALRHAEAAVVASGTATLEAALLECPMVVVYRVAAGTAFFARFMVNVPFYSIVNLLAGKPVVKELIQKDFTGKRVAAEVERLLDDLPARQKMVADFRALRSRLGAGGAAPRAARAVAEMLQPSPRPVPVPPLSELKLS